MNDAHNYTIIHISVLIQYREIQIFGQIVTLHA